MKNMFGLCVAILLSILFINISSAQTAEEVIALVQQTKSDIEKNSTITLQKINAGEHPYKDAENPSLYVFVLDVELNVAAHAINPQTVGINRKGTPDIKGKMFRDEMLEKALKDGKGWVDYYYFNPKTNEVTHKESYFELAEGDNDIKYIVGSGKYIDK